MLEMIARVLLLTLSCGVVAFPGTDVGFERDDGQSVPGSEFGGTGQLVAFTALNATPVKKSDTDCLSDFALNEEVERKEREKFTKARWKEKETKRRNGEVAHKVRLLDREHIRQRSEARAKVSRLDCAMSKYFRRRRRRGAHTWKSRHAHAWSRLDTAVKEEKKSCQVP